MPALAHCQPGRSRCCGQSDGIERIADPTDDTSSGSGGAIDPNLFWQSDAVEVRRVMHRGKGGRGVFARRDIGADAVFERIPVLLLPTSQVFGSGEIARRAARISWYVFNWIHPRRDYVAVALGYGSIYNHSETPNAKYRMELPDIMEFFTLRPIGVGEEITIDYRGDDDSNRGLDFEISTEPAVPPPARESDSGNGGAH